MELTTHKNELHFYKQNKCSQLPVSQNHFVPSPLCNHDRHTQTCSGFICQGAGIRGRYRVASVRGDGGQPCARHSRFQLVTASSSWSQLVPASSTTAPPPSLSLSAMLVASPGKHSSKEKMLHINVEWGKTRCKKQPCTRAEQKDGEEVLQAPEQGLLGSPWRCPHWSRGKV